MRDLTRRQLLAAGAGAVGAVASGGLLAEGWRLLHREDLVPGEAVERRLAPQAWTTTDDHLTFAAIGDNGSGGRSAMAVAEQMASAYERLPYGLVALLGDICYYGSLEDRFEEVFLRPMGPLLDAGVDFELAIGNHDMGLFDDRTESEIETRLRLLGTPGRYYSTRHGPAEFFYLDSAEPALTSTFGIEQLRWLDEALDASSAQWKIVAFHHPPFSSGRHGAAFWVRELVVPILNRHRVDLVLNGHDHHYERSIPIDGTTYVVSGGGCKTTRVRPTRLAAVAASTLEFLHLEISGDRLRAVAVDPGGDAVDRFVLRAREGR